MMLVLSVAQPYAWAIIHGGKNIENRTWFQPKQVIGTRIGIHATVTRPAKDDWTFIVGGSGVSVFDQTDVIYGAIIGTVLVTGVVGESDSQWFSGPFGWTLKDPKPCVPIAIKGQLGLWKYDGVIS